MRRLRRSHSKTTEHTLSPPFGAAVAVNGRRRRRRWPHRLQPPPAPAKPSPASKEGSHSLPRRHVYVTNPNGLVGWLPAPPMFLTCISIPPKFLNRPRH